MLPNVIKKESEYSGSEVLEDWYLSYEPYETHYTVRYTYYYYEPMDYVTTSADNEADARAKMLIYLIENNLITL